MLDRARVSVIANTDEIRVLVQFELTPKAVANSSPGRGPHAGGPRGVEVFALKPLGIKHTFVCRNSEGVETIFGYRDATLSGFASSVNGARLPGVAKAQPWAGISERFQR